MLALLTGLPAKLMLYGGVAVVVCGLGAYALHEHDNRVRAAQDLAASKAIAAQQAEDQVRIQAALQADVAAAQARATAAEAIRTKINAAPRTMACASSPAIGAVLGGLRSGASGPVAKGANPR